MTEAARTRTYSWGDPTVSAGVARTSAGLEVMQALARGELPAPPATPLFADLAPSLLHGRIVMTGEPVDGAFAADLVDHVLLPVLHHRPTP